jgi:hypothetical protein
MLDPDSFEPGGINPKRMPPRQTAETILDYPHSVIIPSTDI